MESLSRNKLRQEVQAMRLSVARGKVHLCRKIITDIKKLSNKKVNDQLKNEKNIRKIQRLTNEVHELKQLKPNAIAEFAVSHTVESAEAMRKNPDISSRNRVLAKLSLHKLIKPLVETFHKSYPKWQELLPKLLDKNATEIGNRSSANEANDIENNISSDCNISDYDNSSNDYFNTDSNNHGVESSEIQTKKLKDVHDPKSLADSSLVKQENLSKENKKITEKKVINSKKSPIKSPLLKSPLSLKKYKLKTPSSAHSAGIKWNVDNITEFTTGQDRVNTLEQNKDEIERKDECQAVGEQKMIEGNLDETITNISQTNDKQAIMNSDEEYQLDKVDKKDISLKILNRKDKRSVSSIESTEDFSIPRNKKNRGLPLTTEEEESDSDNTDTMSHNNEPAKSLKIKSEEKSDMFPSNKIKKLSSDLDKIEKVSPSTQVQQHEDPFFLTKDNEKYLTFGKIVEESKEEPLLKTKEIKTSTKSWDNRKSFNNLRKEGEFQRSNRKFGKFQGPNSRNKSFPESNIKLHPSWEARKKISTILPFEGKKISFDN